MRVLMIVLFVGFGFIVNAQDINYNGVKYKIKDDRIFKDNIDVTETLSIDEKTSIHAAFDEEIEKLKNTEITQKRIDKAEKEQKNAIKSQKRAEKKQKKAENELKKREKAQSNFDKSVKKHKAANNKYEKLKKKGKLSPQDEAKWLEKIEKYKAATVKAKKRLK